MKISWPWLSEGATRAGRIGIAVGPDGLAVAEVDGSGQPQFCQFFPDAGDYSESLIKLVEQRNWQGRPCSVVLHPAYYQLLLTEAPKVEADEMDSAVRWKLKELLEFPVEQAAIEFFPLPEDAYRGRKSMLYAAVMRKAGLAGLIEPVESAGLALDCIEVSELALHKLCYCLPKTRGGSAVLHLFEGEGFINLIEDGGVYLSRKVEQGLMHFPEGRDNRTQFDALLLEVQRSLDFYESQLGKGIISTLYLSPPLPLVSDLLEYLSTQLALNVLPFNVAECIAPQLDTVEIARCATAMGAAIGREPPALFKGEEGDHAAH